MKRQSVLREQLQFIFVISLHSWGNEEYLKTEYLTIEWIFEELYCIFGSRTGTFLYFTLPDNKTARLK